MPEAATNFYDASPRWKHNVGLARQAGDVKAEAITHCVQQPADT